MEINNNTVELVRKIFYPYDFEKRTEVKRKNTRFVHYTSAEVAMNIISDRQMWMRNATTMNDYMEVEHGFDCLSECWRSEPGDKFKQVLDSIFPGIVKDLEDRFNAWLPGIKRDTYLSSFSEHRDEEDEYGRLSMWRAYGGKNGVALVFKNDVFMTEADALKVYSSPVAYHDKITFNDQLLQIAASIDENKAFVFDLGKDWIFHITFNMLRWSVICTKHPGFIEEMEWRVITTPSIDNPVLLEDHIHSVNGIPQRILKIPLANDKDKRLVGLDIPELIDRIIIGPTQYPVAIFNAFAKLLDAAGVENPMDKIFVSNIPLR